MKLRSFNLVSCIPSFLPPKRVRIYMCVCVFESAAPYTGTEYNNEEYRITRPDENKTDQMCLTRINFVQNREVPNYFPVACLF